MRRRLALGALILIDSFIVAIAPVIALMIRFEGVIDSHYMSGVVALMPIVVVMRLASFYAFGCYAHVNELEGICSAITLSSVIIALFTILLHSDLPKSIHILSWFLTVSFIIINRLCIRVVKKYSPPNAW